jgi:hypothetical protein
VGVFNFYKGGSRMAMPKYWGIEDPDIPTEELVILKKQLIKKAKSYYERLEMDSYTETLQELEKVKTELAYRKRHQELLAILDWLIEQGAVTASRNQGKALEYLKEIAEEFNLNMDDLVQYTIDGKMIICKDVIEEQKDRLLKQKEVKDRRMMVRAVIDNFFNPLD